MNPYYTASAVEDRTLLDNFATRWMSPELAQVAADVARHFALVPLYAESSEHDQTRYLFWHPPDHAAFEVRSGRSFEKFERIDQMNRSRKFRLVSLHISSIHLYSGVWIHRDFSEAAINALQSFRISSAETHIAEQGAAANP